ncbi:hypothetical protein NLJ89_g9952 [Agrocybe chaxingu]|uniref:F-box domain-containing protein n=1 Tax=Agrocybe chaxingu TaxID=84603 RepID=A0A9W8MT27_9AGAR|nr:hypothetical protein NLJ89_g9952 [Agrocybe chaxingu]
MAHLLCAICGQDGDFGAEQPKVTCTSWNTTTTPCPNCVQVKTLDEHIEEARAYIRHLKAHRAALRRGGNTFHDPFTSLVPPEIASKILCFCIDGEEFKRRIPLVLSAVSKRWQIIAHSTPLLWASIRLGAYPRSSRYSYEDMLRHWLKRSSQYPLSIDLQANSFTHYAREELENQYRPIIEILNAHCHRWRKLSVAMPLYLLGLLRGNFIGKPLLSHLEIRGDDLDDHDDEDSQTWKFDLGTALPAPHRVSISECRPQRIHINWCNVTDLFLALLRPQEIFALLKAAPLLRECRLSGLLPDVQAASSYQDQDLPVVHHNLIKFTVEIWDVPLSPLFDGLCFPNLNSLFYSGSYASMTPHASFLVRSSCPIKSLTIHLSSDSDHSAELSDILWAVPTLERLDIEGVCVFDNFFQLLADDKGGFKRRRFLPSLMEISQAGSQSWAGMFTWKDISKAVEARASQEGGLPVLKRFRWELHMLPEFDDRFYIDEGSVRVFEQLRADGIDIQLTNHYNKEGRRDMITYSRAYHQTRHEREKKQSTSDG